MEDSFLKLLRGAVSLPSAQERLGSLKEAHQMCANNQARDSDWGAATHAGLAEVLPFCWAEVTRARGKAEKAAAEEADKLASEILLLARNLPEVTS